MPRTSNKKAETAAPAKPQIPLATRPQSANDMLASLAGKGQRVETKKKTAERPVLDMDDEFKRLFADYAPTRVVADVMMAKADALKNEVNEAAMKAYIANLWRNKSQPKNPVLRTLNADGRVDCESMFVVQNRFTVQIPDPDDAANSIAQFLRDSHVAKPDDLVNNELDVSPQVGLRPFNELVSGHYEDKDFVDATPEEKAVGEKLLQFVMSLSDDEKALVLRTTPKVKVKPGFFERVTSYCGTREELEKVMAIFKPVVQNKNAKFGMSDTPVDRINRLLNKASEVLGDPDAAADEEDD